MGVLRSPRKCVVCGQEDCKLHKSRQTCEEDSRTRGGGGDERSTMRRSTGVFQSYGQNMYAGRCMAAFGVDMQEDGSNPGMAKMVAPRAGMQENGGGRPMRHAS